VASDSSAQELLVNYKVQGAVAVAAAIEGDVSPRPNGSADGALTVGDWNSSRPISLRNSTWQTMAASFQRADTAPRSTSGNGQLTLADWVQTGRYQRDLSRANRRRSDGSIFVRGGGRGLVAGALAVANGMKKRVRFV
jgi:hypothetical protein